MNTSAGLRASAYGSYIDYVRKKNVDFSKPDMWLPNSPDDLNAVDAASGALQQRVYHKRKIEHGGRTEENDNITEWQRFIGS